MAPDLFAWYRMQLACLYCHLGTSLLFGHCKQAKEQSPPCLASGRSERHDFKSKSIFLSIQSTLILMYTADFRNLDSNMGKAHFLAYSHGRRLIC